MSLISSLSAALVLSVIIGMANWNRGGDRPRYDLRRKSLEQNQASRIAAADKRKEKRKKRQAPGPDDWVCIGTLEKIIIYPIDDGYGLTEDKAHCTKHGLATDESVHWRWYRYVENGRMRGYHDRTCLAFCKNSRQVKVRHTNSRLLNDSDLQVLINRHLENFKRTLSTITVVYETHTRGWLVYDLGRPVEERVEELIGDTPKLKIGYREREIKTKENAAMRRFFANNSRQGQNWILDGFSANFSSYSLVNTDHIDNLKYICGREDISYWNFRPNLVVKGNGTPHLEEYITDVRIGNVAFANIIPCTHTNSINYDITKERVDGEFKDEPFNYLSGSRRLCNIRPDLSSSLASPIFGINMELKDRYFQTGLMTAPGEIKLNDYVYVKLRQISRPEPRPGRGILKKDQAKN